MRRKQWNAEEWGISAPPEDPGIMYKQVFDHLEDLEVPFDMADRIIAGLEAEKGIPSAGADACEKSVKSFSVIRGYTKDFTARGKTAFAGLGRYAASIAACLVLAVGMFTMSNPAGQKLIGINAEGGSSVSSEIPVKEGSANREADCRPDQFGISEDDSAGNNGENTKEVTSEPDTEQIGGFNGAETSSPNPESSESGTVRTEASLVTDNPEEAASENVYGGTVGNTERRSSGNSSLPSRTADSFSSTETDTSSSVNSTHKNTESGSVAADNDNSQIPMDSSAINTQEQEPRKDIIPSDDSNDPESISQETDSQRPYIFDTSNPIIELNDIGELSDTMGYQPAVMKTLPEGWSISSIEVIWGMTAQVLYSNGEDSVLYRTSAKASVLSSDSGTYDYSKESGIYRLEGDSEDSIRLVTWSFGEHSYSMAFDRAVSEDSALEWAGWVVLADAEK